MNLRTIQVVLRSNVNVFRGEMAQAGMAVRAVGADLDNFDKKAGSAGKTFTAGKVIAAGLAVVVASFGLAIGKTIEFERNMRNVNSISHLSESALGDLSKQVINLSTRLPQSAEDLSAGLYDIASSGFQGAEGLTVLNASAEAASAGLSSTATSAQAITAVLNAYGMDASEATRVSDALFSTVNLGVVSFDQLAGSIGDYVGMAAAAKIPIEEVGAAIATMTLAGISANEAGTSLSRVIQSLIDPSDELATTASELGLNLQEDLANPAIGLHGVMERLRVATGGNLAILIKLFPEIRAARGALALMTAEGQNYNKVFEAMGDKNKNVGATKAALQEQMKGLGFQFDVIKNKANAYVLTLGSALIPKVSEFLKLIGSEGFKNSQIGKLLQDIWDTGGNVVEVLGHLIEAGSPLVGLFLQIAGTPLVATLRVIASTLEFATGILADHKGLVIALAAAYATTLVPGLVASAMHFGAVALAQTRITAAGTIMWARDLAAGMATATTAAGGLANALGLIAGKALMLGAVAGVALLANAWMDAGKRAREYVDEIKKGAGDLKTIGDYTLYINSLEKGYNKAADAARNHKNETSFLNDVFRGGLADQMANIRAAKETRAAHEEAIKTVANLRANYKLMADQTGLSIGAVEALALKVGADFSGSVDSSAPQRKQLMEFLTKMAADAGVSEQALVKMMSSENADPSVLIADMEAVIEAAEKVGEAFAKSTDVIAHFSGETTVSQDQIKEFYDTTIKDTQGFVDNITTLMQSNLDPAVIMRLLQAGPEAAGPLVQAMVGKNSETIIKMMNEGEAALEKISVRATELARLTQTAINATSSEFSDKLPAAIRISELRLQGLTTIDIAAKLGMNISEVTKIAEKFGIVIDETGGKVDEFGTKEAVPKLKADDRDLNEKIRGGHKSLDDLGNETPTPLLKADDRDLNEKIRTGHREMERFGAQTPTPQLKANPSEFNLRIDDGHRRLAEIGRVVVTPQIRGHNQGLIDTANDTHRRMAEVDRIAVTADIYANGSQASAEAGRIIGILNSITSRTWTAQIRADSTAGFGRTHSGGPIFHSGGEVPRFHSGGDDGLKSDEVLSILQRGEYVIQRPSVRQWDALMPGFMAAINRGPDAMPWSQFRPAGGGGSMGSPEQVASLVASMKGGDTYVTIQNVNVKAIPDLRKKDAGTREFVRDIEGALRDRGIAYAGRKS